LKSLYYDPRSEKHQIMNTDCFYAEFEHVVCPWDED